MFDCSIQLMLQFIPMLPGLICIILVLNLCCDLLWGGK